jgi:hypothetical protein
MLGLFLINNNNLEKYFVYEISLSADAMSNCLISNLISFQEPTYGSYYDWKK